MIKLKYLFLLTLLGVISCTKETSIEDNINSSTQNLEHNDSNFRNNNSTNNIQSMVTYNAQHDVLVFNSIQDVYNLQTYLSNQNPYDRGNTTKITQQLDQVINYGFYTGNSNSNNHNAVNLTTLQKLLENSHPLSEASMLKLIQAHQQINFPISFIKNLLIANVPFSFNVQKAVSLVPNLPNLERTTILDADDNLLDRMDYVYEDFLKLFPNYHSLYENMIDKNIQSLDAGMSVTSKQFDECIIEHDFERLIRNDKFEVYIEGQLFKAYTDCKEIKLREGISNAYQELQKLAIDGSPTIPNINETAQGISQSTIDQIIPVNYEVFNPQESDPFGDSKGDPYFNTALQTFNIIETCPVSNFIFALSFGNDPHTVGFRNLTDFSSIADPSSIYQYWNFGDGTGSFESDPIHTYSDFGNYMVSLTSYSSDCGCWHKHQVIIHVNNQDDRGGNPSCEISPTAIDYNPDDYIFTIAGNPTTEPILDGNFVVEYDFIIFKESSSGAGTTTYVETINTIYNNIDYNALAAGRYRVRVDATWNDSCLSSEFTDEIFITNPAGSSGNNCCDKKEKNKEKALPFTVNSNQYEFKFKDIIRGRLLKRVGGQQVLYKKNRRGKMRRVKAHHDVDVGSNTCLPLNGFNGKCKDNPTNNYMDLDNTGYERRFEYGNYLPSADNFGFTGSCDFVHSCSYGGDLIVNAYLSTLICE